MVKIINIDEENLHIFRTTREISIKFSGKMCLTQDVQIQQERLENQWEITCL